MSGAIPQDDLDGDVPGLRSLWLEVPPLCPLYCSYCLAGAGNGRKQNPADFLQEPDYLHLLGEFKDLGGRLVGIPGAGEPFYEGNLGLTEKLIGACGELGLGLTIFTTGHLIGEAFAKTLFREPHVRLMVKWNSSDPEIQNALVGRPGGRYAQERLAAWEVLLRVFEGDRGRLGLVTSILRQNAEEIASLQEWARELRVRFDCDTLLPKGRGEHCDSWPTAGQVRKATSDLRNADSGLHWKPAGAYVHCRCTRYQHHLFVDYRGNVAPCIGCSLLPLGNAKADAFALRSAWEASARRAYAERSVTGVCAACERMIIGDCTSCVGRHLEEADDGDLVGALARGWMPTKGCSIFMPSFSLALQAATTEIRHAMAGDSVRAAVDVGLERLWDPLGSTPEDARDSELDSVRVALAPDSGDADELLRRLRDSGMDGLLVETSPIAVVDQSGRRLLMAQEGFPFWGAPGRTTQWLQLPDRIVNAWCDRRTLSRALATWDAKNTRLGSPPTHVPAEDLSVRAASPAFARLMTAELETPAHASDWHALSRPQRPGPQRLVFSDLSVQAGATRGRRFTLASAWVAKMLTLADVPYQWDRWRFLGVRQPRAANAHETVQDDDVGSLLPRLLMPLTQLAIDRHLADRAVRNDQLKWILWLFYDPCRNRYFRRLLDCASDAQAEVRAPERLALRLLYLWAETDAPFFQSKPTQLGGSHYDAIILNLSDCLRATLGPVDYELIAAEGTPPRRSSGARRLAVGRLLANEDLKAASATLLQLAKARATGISPEHWAVLQTAILESCVSHPAGDVLREAIRALASQLRTLSAAVAPRLQDAWFPDGVLEFAARQHGASPASPKERATAYFVWLGALRLLGAHHYYVGHTHTHAPVQETDAGVADAARWPVTPSGFVVASQSALPDEFYADLRLAYTAVMAPLTEHYARWTSAIEPERRELVRSMPCLDRFPVHYIKKLADAYVEPDPRRMLEAPHDLTGALERHERDLAWVRRLPKADLHVHLGPAVPLDVLADLSALSLFRWIQADPKAEENIKKCAIFLTEVLQRVAETLKATPPDAEALLRTESFKTALLAAARRPPLGDVFSINEMIDRLQVFGLKKSQVACILNIALARLVRDRDTFERSLFHRLERLRDFATYVMTDLREAVSRPLPAHERSEPERGIRQLAAISHLHECKHVLESVLRRYSDADSSARIAQEASRLVERCVGGVGSLTLGTERWSLALPDPLSVCLSVPRVAVQLPEGLESYLRASDLTGSSVLQFPETLALACIETAIHAAKTDAVRYMEVKIVPAGLAPTLDAQGVMLATALLGFSYVTDRALGWIRKEGQFHWLEESQSGNATFGRWPYILANVIVAGKRGADHGALRAAVQLAVDSRDRFLNASVSIRQDYRHARAAAGPGVLARLVTEMGTDIAVSRVVGIDLVGRERGSRQGELGGSLAEAFEKCVMVTIHAGEDEGEKSIWDAIYSLHAQRIGHGLRMRHGDHLSRLIRDRRIPIELCPASNQYTNGYYHDGLEPYVFGEYLSQRMILTINTDDPWISHRAPVSATGGSVEYPLSDEFLLLPLMYSEKTGDGSKRRGQLSRLKLLHLVFNGFDNAFLPASERDELLDMADLETFMVLARNDLTYRPA